MISLHWPCHSGQGNDKLFLANHLNFKCRIAFEKNVADLRFIPPWRMRYAKSISIQKAASDNSIEM